MVKSEPGDFSASERSGRVVPADFLSPPQYQYELVNLDESKKSLEDKMSVILENIEKERESIIKSSKMFRNNK